MHKELKNKTLVLVDNLCGFSLFPLLKTCFGSRASTIYYYSASKIGLKITDWLKAIRVISKAPTKVKNLSMTDTEDCALSAIRFESLNKCLQNQEKINKYVEFRSSKKCQNMAKSIYEIS